MTRPMSIFADLESNLYLSYCDDGRRKSLRLTPDKVVQWRRWLHRARIADGVQLCRNRGLTSDQTLVTREP